MDSRNYGVGSNGEKEKGRRGKKKERREKGGGSGIRTIEARERGRPLHGAGDPLRRGGGKKGGRGRRKRKKEKKKPTFSRWKKKGRGGKKRKRPGLPLKSFWPWSLIHGLRGSKGRTRERGGEGKKKRKEEALVKVERHINPSGFSALEERGGKKEERRKGRKKKKKIQADCLCSRGVFTAPCGGRGGKKGKKGEKSAMP